MKCKRCNAEEAIIGENCIYGLQNQRNELQAHIRELEKTIKEQATLLFDTDCECQQRGKHIRELEEALNN